MHLQVSDFIEFDDGEKLEHSGLLIRAELFHLGHGFSLIINVEVRIIDDVFLLFNHVSVMILEIFQPDFLADGFITGLSLVRRMNFFLLIHQSYLKRFSAQVFVISLLLSDE